MVNREVESNKLLFKRSSVWLFSNSNKICGEKILSKFGVKSYLTRHNSSFFVICDIFGKNSLYVQEIVILYSVFYSFTFLGFIVC